MLDLHRTFFDLPADQNTQLETTEFLAHFISGRKVDDWRLDVLQRFGSAVDDGALAADQVALITDDLPEGVALRMMRGIATESGCLACHGSQVDPEVRAAILRLYPEDRATGFEVGDLRGALWVEVPLTPSSSPTSGEAP